LWGYNEFPLKRAFGPGYFVAQEHGEMEVLIDYAEVPSARPPSWPEIRPASARLGRFVYQGPRDTLRGVTGHVSMGRAPREGQPVDNWLVLCRSDQAD
jgi:hypothetical protein